MDITNRTIEINKDKLIKKDSKKKERVRARKKRVSLGNILKLKADPKAIVDRILKRDFIISSKEIIILSKLIRNRFFGRRDLPLNKKVPGEISKVYIDNLRLLRLRPILIANSPKAVVRVNRNDPVITLLDTRVEINIITRRATDNYRLAIRKDPKLLIVTYNKAATAFYGIYKDVKISVGGIKVL